MPEFVCIRFRRLIFLRSSFLVHSITLSLGPLGCVAALTLALAIPKLAEFADLRERGRALEIGTVVFAVNA